MLYYKIINFFRDIWWSFRERCQRFKRGYAYVDAWNMFEWFIQTIKPMLVHLKIHGIGCPMDFNSRDDWCVVIDEMINCLDLMDEDKVYEFYGFDKIEDYKCMTTEDFQKVYKTMEENKNRFFELFSKYFYDLWD